MSCQSGANDAEDVDAPVGLEALVFNGDDGLAQDGGEVVVADHFAALQGEGADDAALVVVELRGGGGAVSFEVVDLRQIDGVDEGQAGQRAGDDGQQQQEHARAKPAGELAAAMASGTGCDRCRPARTGQCARGLHQAVGGWQPRVQAS